MQDTRRRVKMQKEGMRITDYGLGVKIKKLSENNRDVRAERALRREIWLNGRLS
jgi:hypothetical protein